MRHRRTTVENLRKDAKIRGAMDRFGEKLRTLRRRHTMTQWELAQAIGYASQSYIHEIESGKKQPTAEFIIKVARLFQVSTDQLLLDEIDLTPPSDMPKREADEQ